jgi:hypothetical protein
MLFTPRVLSVGIVVVVASSICAKLVLVGPSSMNLGWLLVVGWLLLVVLRLVAKKSAPFGFGVIAGDASTGERAFAVVVCLCIMGMALVAL